MVVGLAPPPADPMTVCSLSLATWHTTDPTAPDAAETNTTSPSLSIAILSKATQAVSPGPPVVDNRTPVRWIVRHGKFRVVDSQAIRANAPGRAMRSVATVPLNMLATADLGELRDPVLAASAV
jgi:hypothetical protein